MVAEGPAATGYRGLPVTAASAWWQAWRTELLTLALYGAGPPALLLPPLFFSRGYAVRPLLSAQSSCLYAGTPFQLPDHGGAGRAPLPVGRRRRLLLWPG